MELLIGTLKRNNLIDVRFRRYRHTELDHSHLSHFIFEKQSYEFFDDYTVITRIKERKNKSTYPLLSRFFILSLFDPHFRHFVARKAFLA